MKLLPIPDHQQFINYAQMQGWSLSTDQQQCIADLAQWLADRAPPLKLSKYADLPSVLSYAMAPTLVISDLVELNRGKRVVDMGAGSGALGLTLGIIQPGWEVTLMERSSKAATFLEWTVRWLEMENVTVRHEDAALVGADGAAQYDLVCVRAMASAEQALRIAGSLTGSGGYVIAWHQAEDEGFRPPHSPLPYTATIPTVVPGLVASLYRPQYMS